MLTVTTVATTTALTTLETVKSDLGITATDEDTYIERAILRVTELVCNHLRVSEADNGTVTIGRETLSKRFDLVNATNNLFMPRWLPRNWVMTIGSVTENDVLLAATDYRLISGGMLQRMSDDVQTEWPTGQIMVVHTAGWLLPNDSGRDMPHVIEDAAIGLIKLARLDKTRDPTLRSEDILSGLYSYQRFAPSDIPGGMPIDIAAMLEPYVNRTVV
ncbi:MAG TPA: phage head-tail connector protein [Anaerolineae bacterium]